MFLGTLSTVFLGTAKVSITNAMTKGPTGPVLALSAATQIMTVTIAASIWHREWLRIFEFIGILVCMIGTVVLACPEKFVQLWYIIKGKSQ